MIVPLLLALASSSALRAVSVPAQTLAGATGPARPTECSPVEAAAASNAWERAKSPALRRYCDLLASSAAKLAGVRADESQEALALADEAAKVLGDRAAPLALRGRALTRLGRWGEAAASLDAARARDPRTLDEPAALLAWARALARTGRGGDADAAFRALLPRASSLPAADRAAAEIEAALLFAASGPRALGEATAVLRQARRDAQDVLQTVAVLALALTLDRAGARDEARAVLGEAPPIDPRTLLADARVRDVLADAAAAAEADALAAMALEPRDATGAREAWAAYLAGPGARGPWAEHARAHLSSAPRPRRPR